MLLTAIGCVALGAGAMTALRTALPAGGVAACRQGAATMARLELMFGTGRPDGAAVGEVEWQAFVDAEVTPRFPDGLTVLTGYGQWRNAHGIRKEGSRVLLIWHAPAADSEAKIEAVRDAYKARFGQHSVMRVDGLSCVTF
jgi:Protein of unknown function (DUF3574)